MAIINNGNQVISYSYEQEVTASSMNKLNYGLIPPGIYSGGELIRTSDISILIQPFILYYKDTVNELGVKIETSESAVLTVTSTKPYVVGRFSWVESAINYMDFVNVSYAEILSTDILFGRLIFNGSVLTTDYDYSKKSWASPYYTSYNEDVPPFKVYANEPYDTKVTVMPGEMFINGQLVSLVIPTLSPNFTLPAPIGGKTDIVVLDKDGNISIVSSSSPTPSILSNLYYPLAYVTFPTIASTVRGSYISYIHPSIIKSPAFTTFGGSTVGNASGNIPINNGALCTNLNAEFLNGQTPTSNNTISTIVARDSNGNANFSSIGISKPNWTLLKQNLTGTKLTNVTSPKIATFSSTALALLNNYGTGTLEYYTLTNDFWTLVSSAYATSSTTDNDLTVLSASSIVAYF
jgi:hypothetical protein